MPGPNLEVFKFGLYLFFPIVLMVQYGSPDWYNKNVVPYRERIFPRDEDTYKPPHTRSDARTELDRIKANKLAHKLERDKIQRDTPPERLV